MHNWKKTFYTIFAGQAVSILVSTMAQFSIVWWITEQTGSASILGLMSAVGMLPAAIIGPFAGVLVDRYKLKTTIILADMIVALAGLALALAFFLDQTPVWLILTVLAIRSIAGSFHSPANSAMTPQIVPKEELMRVAGWKQTISALSQIAAPFLGIAVLQFFSLGAVLILDVIGAIVASISLLLVKIPEIQKEIPAKITQGIFKELKEGAMELGNYQGILVFTCMAMFLNFVATPIGTLIPLIINSHFRGSGWHASFANMTMGIGMLIGGILLGTILAKKQKTSLIFTSLLLVGTSLATPSLLPYNAFPIFAALMSVLGISLTIVNGAFDAVVQSTIDPSVLGRVSSLMSTIANLAAPLGLLIVAPLAQNFGVLTIFGISGLSICLISMIVRIFFRKTISELNGEKSVEEEMNSQAEASI